MIRTNFQLLVDVSHSEKLDGPYRKVINTGNVSICLLLNGTGNNPMIKFLLSTLDSIVVKNLHPCPYIVSMNNWAKQFLNADTFNLQNAFKFVDLYSGDSIPQFPTGFYEVSLTFFLDRDDIFTLNFMSRKLNTANAKTTKKQRKGWKI